MKKNIHYVKAKKTQVVAIVAIVALGVLLAGVILLTNPSRVLLDLSSHANGADGILEKSKDANKKDSSDINKDTTGLHGGKIFKQGDLSVEVLFSKEVNAIRPKIWMYLAEKQLASDEFRIKAILSRFTGEKKELNFVVNNDVLVGQDAIEEPHAFELNIEARVKDRLFNFSLTKEEGKVDMTDEQIKIAGISLEAASSARIKGILHFPGEVRLNEDRTSHVIPRISGVVERVHASLGQVVKKGQVLAVIASPAASEMRSTLNAAQKRLVFARTTFEREKKLWEQKVSAEQDYLQAQQSLHEAEVAVANAKQKLSALGMVSSTRMELNAFELRAPFDGVVIEKHISQGEVVKEDASVFTVSDMNRIWIEINVPAKDLPMVHVGKKVEIKAADFDASVVGVIEFVSSLIGEQTRSAKARVSIPNPKGSWRPGLFVNVDVTSSEIDVPVAVNNEAIQSVADKPIVFIKIGDGFVAQPVRLGKSDGNSTEIVEGLKAGVMYASRGSFVVKAELGKSSAEDAH